MGILALVVVLVLILSNPDGSLPVVVGRGVSSLMNKCGSSSCNVNSSNNVTVEDKRGVPSGANPLHNR